jgi:ferrous-iron efflux pump FieF
MDSMLDISASVINIVAMHLALRPPDDEHRFGHDKIEDLAIFSQSVFFVFSGLFALYVAGQRFFVPHPVNETATGVNIMLLSIILTSCLLIYQTAVIKKTGSRLVMMDKIHYLTDLCTNFVVLTSVYFSARFVSIDAIFGFLISAYIIYSAYGMLRKALRNLIDEEFDKADKKKIFAVISNYKNQVYAIHALKTRYAGSKPFIQFHVELDPEISLREAHKITDNIMHNLEEIFPGAEVLIHSDPFGIDENEPYRKVIS